MTGETKKPSFFRVMWRITSIQFRAECGQTILNILLSAVHALMFTAVVVATEALFNSVIITDYGQADFFRSALALLLLAGATFGQQLMNGVQNFQSTVVWGKTTGKVRTLLHHKLERVDAAQFENTVFLDDLNKAREGANMISMYCCDFISIFFFYGVYFVSVGAYLFVLKPILLAVIMLSFIPALFAQIVRGSVFTRLEEESAPIRREYEYYQKSLCDREYFKETRILGAFNYFHRLFADTMLLLTRKVWQAEKKTALLQLLLNITSFAGMAIATYLLFTATMAGEISVGAFAAVFGALGGIFSIMQEVVTYRIGHMNKDIGKISNFIRVLDMPERTGNAGNAGTAGTAGCADFSKGIVAQDISFTYPGRETPAVQNVSLSIEDGETIAVVGENGAGKSTLVRLLTGLYRPSSGTVMVGGLNTAQTPPASIYKGISGVFQKYQRYKMTLAENVAISDTTVDINEGKVKAVCEKADAAPDISLGTMLSPEYDGIDLSGGQWQRLSIARGLYRDNNFIVLDEPTAAIDPLEENRIYEQFKKLAEGKCAVVVTHRLGSAKFVNRIIVMDNGKIVDIGNHEELISRPGKYADMWTAQAKWYER